MKIKPIVAIVGRPNVGKSTLFNRLVGARLAIVEDLSGTTRDRLYADAEWSGKTFTLVDTGGLEIHSTRAAMREVMSVGSKDFVSEIRSQVQIAIAEAEAIIFMADAQEGLTTGDYDVAELLRRTAKPVFLAVNKAESHVDRAGAVEFYNLGIGEPYPVSALHGTGTGDLLDAVVEQLPAMPERDEDEDILKIAIVGRPNVGKSSLVNKLLGEERAIVSDIPGTTRDAIDTKLKWQGEEVVLIDTAGIRRRGKVERGVEKYSVLRAVRAIQRADVAVVMIDAVEGITAQDTHVVGYVLEEHKGLIIAVNKWDAIEKDTHTMVEYTQTLRSELKFAPYAPFIFISAKTGQRVGQVIETATWVQEQRMRRLPTAYLNQVLQDALQRHNLPSKWGKKLRVFYITQVGVAPPTFVVFVNDTRLVHFSYERFLENYLREHLGFEGTPLNLIFRARGEKYRGKKVAEKRGKR